jgi:hypothetical protein
MTLAIAHAEADRIILDCIREVRPPFSPDSVTREFSITLKSYGLTTVKGDRYGGMWPRERFTSHGIDYQIASQVKSDIYLSLLPLLNSNRVELLDSPRLISQLVALERRTGRGKDVIDHAPSSHDDVANSVAGCITLAAARNQQRDPHVPPFVCSNSDPLGLASGGQPAQPIDATQAFLNWNGGCGQYWGPI